MGWITHFYFKTEFLPYLSRSSKAFMSRPVCNRQSNLWKQIDLHRNIKRHMEQETRCTCNVFCIIIRTLETVLLDYVSLILMNLLFLILRAFFARSGCREWIPNWLCVCVCPSVWVNSVNVVSKATTAVRVTMITVVTNLNTISLENRFRIGLMRSLQRALDTTHSLCPGK